MASISDAAVRGLATTLSSQIIKFVIGIGVTMVLARMLTPDDYGLVAMVTVFTGLLAIFRDGGLSIVTVQRAKINNDQLSSLFWINTILGLFLFFFVVLLSPVIGRIYGNNDLALIASSLAITFLFTGIAAQPQAILQRQMRFKTLAYIEIFCLITSAATGIYVAYIGWGYWALVVMSILSVGTNTVLVFVCSGWRPTLLIRVRGVSSMLKFGGELTIMKFFDSLTSSLDSFVIGKFYSAEVLGLYSRAQSLMLLPFSQVMPPILSVFLPVLSRLAEFPGKLRQVFLDLLVATVNLSSFISVFFVVGADWLIAIILGSQWAPSSNILRLLVGPAFFIPISTLCIASITAQGNGSILAAWSLIKNLILTAAILVGAFYGVVGIATSLSLVSFLLLLPLLLKICSQCGLGTFYDLGFATLKALLNLFIACSLIFYVRSMLEIGNVLLGLLIVFFINTIVHCSGICLSSTSRNSFKRIIGVVLRSRT